MLEAELLVSIKAREVDAGDVGTKVRITPVDYFLALTDGTGANQAQVVWSASRTATPSSEDLAVTALPDTRDGAAVVVAFSAVKAVYVRNKSSSGLITLGLASINNFSGFPASGGLVRPGGCYVQTAPSDAGMPVSAGNVARIRTSIGTADYDIILIGEGTVT